MANVNLQAALDGLTQAGKEIAGDSQAALAAVAAYVDGLRADTGQILDAAATALANGQDVSTWTNALKAQVEAVALDTLDAVEQLSVVDGEKIKSAALGALHAVLAVAVAAA